MLYSIISRVLFIKFILYFIKFIDATELCCRYIPLKNLLETGKEKCLTDFRYEAEYEHDAEYRLGTAVIIIFYEF